METWAAVYRIRNPRTSPIENGPQAWAVKRLAAEPVVLAYDIPSEALMEAGNQGLDPSDLFGPDMQVIRTVLLPAPCRFHPAGLTPCRGGVRRLASSHERAWSPICAR